MSNGLNHAVLLVVRNFRHESKVEDDEAAVRRAEHVPGVGVCVEEARVQELGEVGDDAKVH
eukprot:CAMPEP_0118980650 /NCGR_PEP_ID=MMETSP1173-20130426/28797_1 /TAXON_ID=1034831 /ORGANISM="Rhizochromulina marina cf, Strain CCMP1243" /LENGTH=60 /DNA_ID=CAMNT_0006931009 /DNA_START=1 /DNA_END=183 /DNA_ORIENTATION=-